jgi:hypothetical protein
MDITGILKTSKEMLLEHKSMNPTLFVETKDKRGKVENLLIVMTFLGDNTLEKMKQFFLVGRKVGTSHPGRELTSVCFVVEAWISTYTDEEAARHAPAPSEDPHRKEVLAVSSLAIADKTVEQSMQYVEMLRDGSGELVDLLQNSDQIEVGHNNILMAFLAGYTSARLPDREMAKLIAKYAR